MKNYLFSLFYFLLSYFCAKLQSKPFINKLQMLQKEKINAFVELGKFLSQFSLDNNTKNEAVLNNDLFYLHLKNLN